MRSSGPKVRTGDVRTARRAMRPVGRLGRWVAGERGRARIRRAPVTSSLSRCRPPPPAETALWAGVRGGPWVGAGIGAAGPGGWVEERAAQRQGDGERQPCAEQADGVHGDEGEVAGAEPVDQPDGVAAGVGGEEAARDLTRCAAGEHLPCLQKRGEGGEHAVGGRRGAEELRGAGEHRVSLFHSASLRLDISSQAAAAPAVVFSCWPPAPVRSTALARGRQAKMAETEPRTDMPAGTSRAGRNPLSKLTAAPRCPLETNTA